MHATQKFAENRKILHELVPLNSISPERFAELSEKIIIESVRSGHYLFRKGDRDNQTIFLLDGKINLIDGHRKVAAEIVSGTEQSRHPISNLQPRQYAARAATRSVIARVDSGLLDVFLTWDPSHAAEVAEIGAVDSGDWMTRMLQSKAFVKLPPSLLQALLMRFKPIEVQRGQVIITQGSEGDHFYTIHEGRCVVTRREAPDAPEQKLAELGSGDSFGEESLVSESRRNASITMLTDGLLMRLSKEDFVDLLKTQLVQYVDYEEAKRLVDDGAVWVDVRTPDEYENGAFEDSVNIPLSVLRGEMPELVYNAKYVICCDTGSRSDSAAFVLSHRGFDVCVLAGGMSSLAPEETALQEDAGPEPESLLDGGCDVQGVELLMAELEQERQARESVVQQLDMVRGELAESGEKLAEYYIRVKQLEEEQHLYAARFTAMREKHAEQLRAVSEELDQEKIQSHSLRRSVSELKSARDALRRELESERKQSEAQYLNLQEQLERVQARAAEKVQAGSDAQPAAVVREDGLRSGNEELLRLRNVLRSVSGERRLIDGHVQQLKRAVNALADSMRRINDELPDTGPDEGGDLEA